MKHLGDITKINGANVPATMVVIGGSPCQDLSVAGKRVGLAGERSGLFMEQIRVIKEMRKADEQRKRKADNVKPRYMVWENVPGAFSSNKGADFAAVLEETLKVVKQETPDILVPDKGWPLAGCLYDDEGGWSIAWRVFDAQFWGTPQRRRRIALIADFGGLTAPEILFERKGLSRYTPPSRTAWKDFAPFIAECTGSKNFNRKNSDVGNTYCIQGNCIDRADTAGCNGKGWTEGVSYTLNTVERPAVCNVGILNDQGGQVINADDNAKTSPTLRAEMHGNLPCVYDTRRNGDGTTVPTITGDHNNRVTDYTSIICMATQQGGAEIRTDDKAPTLTAAAGTSGNNQPVVAHGFPLGFRPENTQTYEEKATTLCNGTRAGFCNGVITLDRAAFNQGTNAKYDMKISNDGVNSTLTSKGPSAVCTGAVRRLTPLECERLQGFPDGWTDIGDYIDTKGKKRKTSDSARYKALGNSIALPSWVWVLERLSYCCGADRTMASLFDGIGGFPLIWEAINGQGTCLWASEIEEFPIAVTKYHFTETE